MAQRRMNPGMQAYGIGRMIATHSRHDTDKFDVGAHLDRSLHFDENSRNIKRMLGISDRDRGTEQLHQQAAERKREQVRRKDTLRQTGPLQGALGRLMDGHIQAMRPGKRISESGHRYYERRESRSDKGKLL
jgi:hypothetical protein